MLISVTTLFSYYIQLFWEKFGTKNEFSNEDDEGTSGPGFD
jgi:hypothetical protein